MHLLSMHIFVLYSFLFFSQTMNSGKPKKYYVPITVFFQLVLYTLKSKILERKWYFCITFPHKSPSLLEVWTVITAGRRRQESKHEGILHAGLLSMSCPLCFLIYLRAISQGFTGHGELFPTM